MIRRGKLETVVLLNTFPIADGFHFPQKTYQAIIRHYHKEGGFLVSADTPEISDARQEPKM